jgi:L-alanine-DL-glutamate epimerase-like enolase superfamily enzyme
VRIERIETFATPQVCFVRVTTEDGLCGVGQTAPYCADIVADVLHRLLSDIVLGADPLDVEGISRRCIEGNLKFPWSFVCRALAGVDTALWDLRGKLEGKSVCRLLGSEPRPIPVYGSSMRRDITPEDEARRMLRLADEKGFRAFKARVGSKVGHDADTWPGRTEQLVSELRDALGEEIDLLFDANSGYTPAKAIEVGHLLEDYGAGHFEEPCPYWQLEWTAEVADVLEVPVAGGEQDNDLAQWERMMRLGAVDIAQPDVCYVGGLTRALEVARLADAAGRPCVPHSANLSMVTLFTLHLLAAIPNAGKHAECSIESPGWVEGLFAPALEVIDGHIAIPDGPGWGVTVSPDFLARAERKVSELSS